MPLPSFAPILSHIVRCPRFFIEHTLAALRSGYIKSGLRKGNRFFVTRKISAPRSASFAACNFVAIIINAIRTKSHCVCKGEISARNGCGNVFIRVFYDFVFHIRSFLYCKYTPGCPFCQQQLACVFGFVLASAFFD